MKGLIYNGPRDVRVTNIDDPTIERETDALVKITTTNICGSDLHMYEGRTRACLQLGENINFRGTPRIEK
jgi:glutathione-independent formaldehyde dehydrogenase